MLEGTKRAHCDCNMVPGILELGGLPGVAGLIAPRHLLAVNGRKDPLFMEKAIEDGAATVKAIFNAAGCADHFEHRWGTEGHRFYSELMWPFVAEALASEMVSKEAERDHKSTETRTNLLSAPIGVN